MIAKEPLRYTAESIHIYTSYEFQLQTDILLCTRIYFRIFRIEKRYDKSMSLFLSLSLFLFNVYVVYNK